MTASLSTPPSARMTSPPSARMTSPVAPDHCEGPPLASRDGAPPLASESRGEPARLPEAVFAVVLGVALMVVAFANLEHLPRLAQDFGTVWVYLVFFLYMSIGGRVFWWGADTLVAEFRRKSNTAGDRR